MLNCQVQKQVQSVRPEPGPLKYVGRKPPRAQHHSQSQPDVHEGLLLSHKNHDRKSVSEKLEMMQANINSQQRLLDDLKRRLLQ